MTKRAFLLAAMAACYCLPSWADTYSFAAVKNAGITAEDIASAQYGYTDSTLLSSTAVATASGVGNAAKAQTLPGVNRIGVSNSIAVTDEYIRKTGVGGPFAIALSAWTDDFVVTGGAGSGTALVSVNVTGQFGEGYGSGGGYRMWLTNPQELRSEVTEYLSTDPTAWLNETIDQPVDGGETLILSYQANVLKPGYTDPGLSLPGGSPFGGVFTAQIQFKYGEAFSLASVLFGSANDFGSLSAMNSAHFGISVLDNAGASIAATSGTAYAAAVPEPLTSTLMLSGLAALALAARKSRR
jgi:hypothetical protein